MDMNVSLILAHPNPTSFNHAIASTAAERLRANGCMVRFHDLYAEQFDPLLYGPEFAAEASLPPSIVRHCDELREADGVVIVHPNWWGQPPAILKGWIDRVLRAGTAYRFVEGDQGEGVPVGLLKARVVVVFNTANTPPQREREVFGDPLQLLWKNCIFDLCGSPVFYRRMFTVVVGSTAAQRQEWLGQVESVIDRHFTVRDGRDDV